MMAIFIASPIPNQMIASGISASLGIGALDLHDAVDERVAEPGQAGDERERRRRLPTPSTSPIGRPLDRGEQVRLQPAVGDQLAHASAPTVTGDGSFSGSSQPSSDAAYQSTSSSSGPSRRWAGSGLGGSEAAAAAARARVRQPPQRVARRDAPAVVDVVDIQTATRGGLGVAARRARDPEVLAQRRALVLVAEQAAPLQLGHDAVDERGERRRERGRDQVEPVGGAGAEPLVDRVGDLLRRAGHDAVAAAGAEPQQQAARSVMSGSRSTIRWMTSKRLRHWRPGARRSRGGTGASRSASPTSTPIMFCELLEAVGRER